MKIKSYALLVGLMTLLTLQIHAGTHCSTCGCQEKSVTSEQVQCTCDCSKCGCGGSEKKDIGPIPTPEPVFQYDEEYDFDEFEDE